MNLAPSVFSLPIAIFLAIVATGMLKPMASAQAAIKTLVSGTLHNYLNREASPRILENKLNTIQDTSSRGNLIGVNLDTDSDGLIDLPGDVAAAMQFSMDIPVGGSASLAVDYIGGRISNAFIDLVGDALPLQAGDADQDLDFDQFDLVQVQVAAKYLTAEAATWGEGNWNGAPGGTPGGPPAGNRLFDQLDIIAALGADIYLSGPYGAIQPNVQSGDGQTSIVYNAATGEVSADALAGVELTSINIDSAAGVFTGQADENLGGSFDNDAGNNVHPFLPAQ